MSPHKHTMWALVYHICCGNCYLINYLFSFRYLANLSYITPRLILSHPAPQYYIFSELLSF